MDSAKVSHDEPFLSLADSKFDSGERVGNLILAAIGTVATMGGFAMAGTRGENEGRIGAGGLIAFGLVYLMAALGKSLLRRTVLVDAYGEFVFENYEVVGYRRKQITAVRQFDRIDVLRRKRSYDVQLTGKADSPDCRMRNASELSEAEGFALHVASITGLPAMVFDFECPQRSDVRFARQLNI